MTRSVMVVDDEPLARARLQRLIERLDGYEVVAEAENGLAALQILQTQAVDICCVDIRMPAMDGLTLAAKLQELPMTPAVIFCTAYDEYALQAFDANACAYLLKPVEADKLKQGLERATRLSPHLIAELDASMGGGNLQAVVLVERHGELHRIPIGKMRAFLADNKYVSAYHCDGVELMTESLKQLEEDWPEHCIRVHRNALVFREAIKALEKDAMGRFYLTLHDTDIRPQVSRRQLGAIRQILKTN